MLLPVLHLGTAIAFTFREETKQGTHPSGATEFFEDKDMLSHIVNLVSGYQDVNGIRPNLVYMNETHYSYLREELPGVRDHMDLVSILGVDIALSEEAIQPSVATVRFGDENILVS
jgi:hypothetical protein